MVPLFFIYVVVELAAVVALASTIGIGWTLLILLATFVAGLALAGSQIKRQLRRLRSGLTTPQGAVGDSALVALGTLLVVIPGLVTSTLGALLLMPPTRAAARPALAFLAARGIVRRAPLITVAGMGTGRRYPGRGDYIDGEVVDVTPADVTPADVIPAEPPALPYRPQ